MGKIGNKCTVRKRSSEPLTASVTRRWFSFLPSDMDGTLSDYSVHWINEGLENSHINTPLSDAQGFHADEHAAARGLLLSSLLTSLQLQT